MEFTGERYVPELDWPDLSYEHWHRYLWASQFVAGKDVLDVACGEGYGSNFLAKTAGRVVGVDISQETVDHAKNTYNQPNIEFYQGSAGAMPIEGTCLFDIIISFETIEHLDETEQRRFMAEVKRLLKPEGIFIVSTPNRLIYTDKRDVKNEYHLKEFSPKEFIHFLKGFFDTVHILAQHIYPISYIWPLDIPAQEWTEYQIDFPNGHFEPVSDDRKETFYMLSVCSDSMLTHSTNSVLLDVAGQAFRQGPPLRTTKEQLIHGLKTQVVEQEQMLQRLQSHESTLTQLQIQLSEREQAARILSAQVVEQTDLASMLRNELTQQEQFTREVAARMSERNDLVEALKVQLVEKERVARGLHTQLGEQARMIDTIYRSKRWRLAQKIADTRSAVGRVLRWPYRKLRRNHDMPAQTPALPTQITEPKGSTSPARALLLSDRQMRALGRLLERLDITIAPEQLLARLNQRMTVADQDNLLALLNFLAADTLVDQSIKPASMVVRGTDLPAARYVPAQRPNILIISGEFPNPMHAGGGRLADFIMELSKDHTIYLYAWFAEEVDRSSYETLKPFCHNIKGVSLDEFERGYVADLQQLIADTPIDIVYYEWPRSLIYYDPKLGRRHIFTYHESVSLSRCIALRTEQLLSDQWLSLMLDLLKALRMEVVDTDGMDGWVVNTPTDGEFLGRFTSGKQYTVISTSIKMSEFCLPDRAPEKASLTFVGSFRHLPNEDAMLFFREKIYRLVKAQVPELKVYIVGAYPSERIRALHDHKHIFVTGMVDDIRPYIQRATVCIAPLISGAGIRGKVNQYAALKRVCVSTSIGAVDLVYEDGRDIFIADDPSIFAERIITLLQNPDLAQRMGLAAYEKAKDTYDLQQAAESLRRLNANLLGSPRQYYEDLRTTGDMNE